MQTGISKSAKAIEEIEREIVINPGISKKSDGGQMLSNKGKEEEEGRYELPDIFRLFPAPPGSAPPWKHPPCSRVSGSDLTDHKRAAEDDHVI